MGEGGSNSYGSYETIQNSLSFSLFGIRSYVFVFNFILKYVILQCLHSAPCDTAEKLFFVTAQHNHHRCLMLNHPLYSFILLFPVSFHYYSVSVTDFKCLFMTKHCKMKYHVFCYYFTLVLLLFGYIKLMH